jgi:homoserine O-succinyltransferase/O-acetyltransferase
MSASLYTNPSSSDRQTCAKGLCAKPSAACLERSSKSLTIGLINNMPDGALEATERQFLSLLDSASEGISVRLALYSLPGVPRNEFGAHHINEFYSSAEDLWGTQLDGLIVTGREPLTPNLKDEPYWKSFTRLLEWARDNTHSAIWSCLAAHAATLHMDGIRRIKSDSKQSGVFDCTRLADHSLTAGTSSRFKIPHSRWNGLPEDELMACGYDVLTRAGDVGVDTFIKQEKSMFVFFQGHPEYESNALMLEYRRDIGRYRRGETNTYPLMPHGYFDHDTAIALAGLEQEAKNSLREELMLEVSRIIENLSIENTWRSTAVCLYRSWLQYICAQKKLQLEGTRITIPAHAVNDSMPGLASAGSLSASTVFVAEHNVSSAISNTSRNALTIL